jgi:hypothetical protein
MEANVFRADGAPLGSATDDRVVEMLARLERDLNDLVQGLNLLGAKRCSHCNRFYRSSDPRSLFIAGGEQVCVKCIPQWWPARREQLSGPARQEMEANLAFWLRSFHNARSVKASRKATAVKFELVVACLECRGTGKYMGGRRCRYCDGPGTIRVIVPEASR